MSRRWRHKREREWRPRWEKEWHRPRIKPIQWIIGVVIVLALILFFNGNPKLNFLEGGQQVFSSGKTLTESDLARTDIDIMKEKGLTDEEFIQQVLKLSENCPLFYFVHMETLPDNMNSVRIIETFLPDSMRTDPKRVQLPSEYLGWTTHSNPWITPSNPLGCRKGKYQGENANYWYCGKEQAAQGYTYVSKTLMNADGTIGKTIRRTIYLIYDQDENYVKTVCGDDPDVVATRNLKAGIKQMDDFFNSISP